MKVVVFSPYYPPAFRAGGPVKSISRLVRASTNPLPTLVVSRNWDLGERVRLRNPANTWVNTGEEDIWAYDRDVTAYVRSLLAAGREKPRLVYVNSLFDPWMTVVPALGWWVAGSRRSDLVIAARGQLAQGALAKSASRKRALLWLWRRLAAHRRVIVHAATENERDDVQRVLGNVDVVVRPDDVGPLLPALNGPLPQAELRAVFLGRIVPIKGLLELLESLRHVEHPMLLDIYGPEEDQRYVQLCRRQARQLFGSVQVRFMGPVPNDAVRSVLSQYDVMLNPTRGESFGQVIGESLSVGTPVAVAPVTPWTSWIEASNGGIIVRDGRWAEAAKCLSAMDETSREQIREGARHAYENFWWDAQGRPHVFEMVLSLRS